MKVRLIRQLLFVASSAAVIGAATSASAAGSVEIRFCPSAAVHVYPLESRRELNSLMLQNVAVLNAGPASFKVERIELELLREGKVLETKVLDAGAIERAGTRGAKMQEAGVIRQVAFQFCGEAMIPPSFKLAGPNLEGEQALLISSQVFAFNGARDTARVRVHGTSNGRKSEVTGSIPVKMSFAKNSYIFPLRGNYFVGVSASFHTPHRWAIPEEFGYDIAQVGESGLTYRGDGTRFEDYYAYGAEILAAADGTVVEAVDGVAEDTSAMQRPDESQEAYFALAEGTGAAPRGRLNHR